MSQVDDPIELLGADPEALAEVVRSALRPGIRPVVLLDGGSGAGKTTLAHALRDRLAGSGPEPWRVVNLDDCYPGWHGLDAGRAQIPGMLAGARPGYRRWDWAAERPGAWVDLPTDQPLLIEGCGAIGPDTVGPGRLAVWCELDEPARRARATSRDGESTSWWWPIWAEQEQRHWQRDRPRELAGVRIRVDPEGPGAPLG